MFIFKSANLKYISMYPKTKKIKKIKIQQYTFRAKNIDKICT